MSIYVDGFNFYHGLMARGWGRYRWLDYRSLLLRRIREDQKLVAIKYFTALVTHQPEKLARQQVYLRALELHTGLVPILGHFEPRPTKCQVCDGWYKRPQEKRTDVNIATHLVADAHKDEFDTAYMICADGDLVPALEHIRTECNKQVALIDPPRRHSNELAGVVDRHWNFSRAHLAQSLLPNPVEWTTRRGKVRRIYAPSGWVAESGT